MGLRTTILDALIFGVRYVFANGTPAPVRTALNFVGAIVEDDPTNKRTNVTFPGVLGVGLPKVLDATSAPVDVGQYIVPMTGGTTYVLATPTTVATFDGVLAIALTAGNPGDTIYVSTEDTVPNSVTGLGAGLKARVKLNTATGRVMRVTTTDYVPGDIPLGNCNTAGDLLQDRGNIVEVNAMTLQGATVPDCTAMTTGQILRATGAAAFGLGALDLANAAAVTGQLPLANVAAFTAGKLPLANETAPTTTGVKSVPTATTTGVYDAACSIVNGANGIAGLDGSAKLPLANQNNATIEVKAAQDATAWATVLDSFTTTSYVDSGTYKVTLTSALAVGDKLKIRGRIFMNVGSTTTMRVALAVVEGGGTFQEIAGSIYETGTAGFVLVCFEALYTITATTPAGTCVVKVQGKRPAGSGVATIDSQGSLIVEVLR
jgi:hypothetical protein